MLRKFLIFSFLIVGCRSSPTTTNTQKCPDSYSVDLLASLINSEAGDSYQDMYLVGSTVLNRMDHDMFPDGLYDVIFQKNQYYGIENRKFRPTQKSRQVAEDLLLGVNRDTAVLFFIKVDDEFSFGGIREVKKTEYHKFFVKS